MKVLIIPEDFRKDQYMLKPIIEAMLAYLDRPRSKVKDRSDHLNRMRVYTPAAILEDHP